ncbi:MAG TPA: hypothetical protein VE907_21565 [Gammaproteobacteria bacterium]|nr:hypothetical protein [Gammaproteobacteria bacterium]
MRRAFALLVVLAAVGGVALYLARGRAPVPGGDAGAGSEPRASLAVRSRGTPSASDAVSLQRELFRLLGPGFGRDEQAAVDALVARASRAQLEALARAVAALPDIAAPRYALEALLARYAAIDPGAAVALAREIEAPVELLAALHRDWAGADPGPALRALDAYDPARASRLARELLSVIGDDDDAIERLLAAAPRLDAGRLRAAAAVARATHDLTGALRAAASLPPTNRRDALARIAVQAANDDAPAALLRAASLDAEFAAEFSSAVLREWAKRDPEAMLGYALALGPDAQRAAIEDAGLEAFAQLPPARVLAILERLPDDLAPEVRRIELLGMARTDPLAALGYAEALPPGPDRTRALDLAVRGYAQTDPEAALAWAQSLRPPEPGLVASALLGFARVDPDRAIELLLADASSQRLALAQSLVIGRVLDADHVAALVSRWPASGQGRFELQTLTSGWAFRDPKPALEWLIANDQRAPGAGYTRAAEALGKSDPDAAAAYLRRIPSELRPAWIKAAAAGYAAADPRAAAVWVAQYAGQEGHDAALATVAQRAAGTDPSGAAALLRKIDVAGTAEARGAAEAIARRWSAVDAPAARAWATSLPASDARDAALSIIGER